jgi:dihydrofolate reductase
MGTVLVDMVMSLDGFIAGPNNDDGGLHDWYFTPSGNAVGVIDELLQTIGAMIIGRRSFGDQPDGFDTPYKVPHFVLTHTPRHTVTNGDVPFIFVADGIERALAQAQAAAGEKAVCIAGGGRRCCNFSTPDWLTRCRYTWSPSCWVMGCACLSTARRSTWSAPACWSRLASPTCASAYSNNSWEPR